MLLLFWQLSYEEQNESLSFLKPFPPPTHVTFIQFTRYNVIIQYFQAVLPHSRKKIECEQANIKANHDNQENNNNKEADDHKENNNKEAHNNNNKENNYSQGTKHNNKQGDHTETCSGQVLCFFRFFLKY